MADTTATQDTTDVVDTGADESVDTSTNDTQLDDDIALEDIEISEAEIGDDDDDMESEESDDDSAATDESDESESEDDVDASDNAGETDEDDDDAGDPEESEADIKARNDAYAQKRIAEREARQREQEVEKAKEDVRIEQYLKEAQGNEVELEYRQAQVEKHLMQRERVALNQEKLGMAVDRAVGSIDLFKNGTPEVKEALGEAIDDFINMNVVTDDYGNPLEVKGDLYTYLQKKADSIRKLQGVGVRQANKDRANTKARTMSAPSQKPREPKKDADVSDFDSYFE